MNSMYFKKGSVIRGNMGYAIAKIPNETGVVENVQLCEITSFEAKQTINKNKLRVTNKIQDQSIEIGSEGTGSIKYLASTSRFAVLASRFNEGKGAINFDITVTTNDPNSDVGEQVITFRGCSLDEVELAKFTTSEDFLEASSNFTFDDYIIEKEFLPYSTGIGG